MAYTFTNRTWQEIDEKSVIEGESANINSLTLSGSLTMEIADDPAAEGLFMRIGPAGEVVGYRAVNQDLEWVATDSSDITLADTETFIISITVDHDVTAANGSYMFTCKIGLCLPA